MRNKRIIEGFGYIVALLLIIIETLLKIIVFLLYIPLFIIVILLYPLLKHTIFLQIVDKMWLYATKFQNGYKLIKYANLWLED